MTGGDALKQLFLANAVKKLDLISGDLTHLQPALLAACPDA
jgi:hypothetical protein